MSRTAISTGSPIIISVLGDVEIGSAIARSFLDRGYHMHRVCAVILTTTTQGPTSFAARSMNWPAGRSIGNVEKKRCADAIQRICMKGNRGVVRAGRPGSISWS